MKIDFKKKHPDYKARAGKIALIEVAPTQYLMLDGSGDPNTSESYAQALQALYPLSYKLKFHSKNELGRDYTVPPLEALWWADDMAAFTDARDKSKWHWTAMIMVPEWLDATHIESCRAQALPKSPLVADIRLESLNEALCVQTLHIGPYDAEGPILAEIHDVFIPGNGLAMRGKHHEIYLSDARRTAPERLRTILRQPVQRL